MWWIPLGKGDGSDGWLSSSMGLYRWRGPAHDVTLPPPNAKLTDPPAARRVSGKEHSE